jgi:undecaprenyl-diphosphatase
MNFIQAFLLGLVQGVTEFFPVSSSGHLVLFQFFFGLTQLKQYVLFNLCCHLGTMTSLIIILNKEFLQLFSDRRRLIQLVIGTLPLFPMVFAIKPIKSFFETPQYLGPCFLVTAAILYLGIRRGFHAPSQQLKSRRWKDAFLIGTSQGMALIPGISRSGTTITTGRLLGWGQQQAILFSLFLSVPAILGGIALELFHLWKERHVSEIAVSNIGIEHYIIGYSISALMGCFGLRLLLQLASKGKFMYFVWYCLALGIGTTLYFLGER